MLVVTITNGILTVGHVPGQITWPWQHHVTMTTPRATVPLPLSLYYYWQNYLTKLYAIDAVGALTVNVPFNRLWRTAAPSYYLRPTCFERVYVRVESAAELLAHLMGRAVVTVSACQEMPAFTKFYWHAVNGIPPFKVLYCTAQGLIVQENVSVACSLLPPLKGCCL